MLNTTTCTNCGGLIKNFRCEYCGADYSHRSSSKIINVRCDDYINYEKLTASVVIDSLHLKDEAYRNAIKHELALALAEDIVNRRLGLVTECIALDPLSGESNIQMQVKIKKVEHDYYNDLFNII